MSDAREQAPAVGATASATPTPASGTRERLRRFYWMDERMAAAVRDGFGAGDPGYRCYELGCAALTAAERLLHTEELALGRLLLLRLGVAHLSRATRARAGARAELPPAWSGDPDFELGCVAVRTAERLRDFPGTEPGAALLYEEASELFARARPSAPPEPVPLPSVAGLSEADQRRLRLVVDADGARRLAALPAEEWQPTARLLERVAEVLAAPLRADAARVQRVWWSRRLRIGLTAALLLAAPVTLLLRALVATGPNLALHQAVTMSSTYPAGDVGRDPSALVDGDRENMGFHTDRGGPQQVTIDLGAERRTRSVVVYNRTDCCAANAVPLRIEVSTDGRAYREVARRTADFMRWRASFSPIAARYVRLVAMSGEYFHLAEVEVY